MLQTGNPSLSSGCGDKWLLLNPAHPAASSSCPKEDFLYPLCHHPLLKEKPTEQLIPISVTVCRVALLSPSPAVEHLWTWLGMQVCRIWVAR